MSSILAIFLTMGICWILWSQLRIMHNRLSDSTNDKLVKKFERGLKPGTKVISHVFEFKQWKPVKVDEKHNLFMYVIRGE